jgi:hypothetical protein
VKDGAGYMGEQSLLDNLVIKICVVILDWGGCWCIESQAHKQEHRHRKKDQLMYLQWGDIDLLALIGDSEINCCTLNVEIF